jgi:hypothetical protein
VESHGGPTKQAWCQPMPIIQVYIIESLGWPSASPAGAAVGQNATMVTLRGTCVSMLTVGGGLGRRTCMCMGTCRRTGRRGFKSTFAGTATCMGSSRVSRNADRSALGDYDPLLRRPGASRTPGAAPSTAAVRGSQQRGPPKHAVPYTYTFHVNVHVTPRVPVRVHVLIHIHGRIRPHSRSPARRTRPHSRSPARRIRPHGRIRR